MNMESQVNVVGRDECPGPGREAGFVTVNSICGHSLPWMNS